MYFLAPQDLTFCSNWNPDNKDVSSGSSDWIRIRKKNSRRLLTVTVMSRKNSFAGPGQVSVPRCQIRGTPVALGVITVLGSAQKYWRENNTSQSQTFKVSPHCGVPLSFSARLLLLLLLPVWFIKGKVKPKIIKHLHSTRSCLCGCFLGPGYYSSNSCFARHSETSKLTFYNLCPRGSRWHLLQRHLLIPFGLLRIQVARRNLY